MSTEGGSRGAAMPAAPMPTRTASEQVADRILAAMAAGVLQPGERIPAERDLAERLGVSRWTVRAGLERLAAMGVTTSRRGRYGGTFASQLPEGTQDAVTRTLRSVLKDLDELFDCHYLLQQLLARTAAERHSRSDDTAMKAASAKYRKTKTAAESRTADSELHAAIARAAGNPHLTQLARSVEGHINLGFEHGPYSPRLHEIACEQHAALVAAITASNGDEASRIAREHFRVTTGDAWQAALGEASTKGRTTR